MGYWLSLLRRFMFYSVETSFGIQVNISLFVINQYSMKTWRRLEIKLYLLQKDTAGC
jgi:hypothetical protein